MVKSYEKPLVINDHGLILQLVFERCCPVPGGWLPHAPEVQAAAEEGEVPGGDVQDEGGQEGF